MLLRGFGLVFKPALTAATKRRCASSSLYCSLSRCGWRAICLTILQSCRRFQSPLEKRPRYARAIGMIAVEITNLEILLGEMLAVLLHIQPDLGRAIYLTPTRCYRTRLDIPKEFSRWTLYWSRAGTAAPQGFHHHKTAQERIFDRRHAMDFIIHGDSIRKGRVPARRNSIPLGTWRDRRTSQASVTYRSSAGHPRSCGPTFLGVSYELRQSWESFAKAA